MTHTSYIAQPVYSTFGADPEFQQLVDLFVQEMPQRIQKILHSLQQADLENLYRICHQLKGAAGGYGFLPISLAAAEVLDAIQDHLPEQQLQQRVECLVALCQQARAGSPQSATSCSNEPAGNYSREGST
ncbi:MAG: Hpt domain-containing protein [Thermoguttaceae bacterium]|nr:Hpt domain-containing protein [Thermoguttaceae bacterium]MDW8038242.1 Hpt domain-containing protein [Thermoguttaceae bacterium]